VNYYRAFEYNNSGELLTTYSVAAENAAAVESRCRTVFGAKGRLEVIFVSALVPKK